MLQFLLRLVCIFIGMSSILLGSDIDDYFRSLNHSGREFWFTFPPISENQRDTAEVRVLLLSPTKQTVTVEIPGRGFFEQVEVEPFVTTEVPIPGIIAQPYTLLDGVGSPADTVWQGAAVHVFADDPVVVQGQSFVPFNGEVFAVLPVHVLGRQYGISSYYENSMLTLRYSPADACIVAVEDSTEITFYVSGHAGTVTTGGVGRNGIIRAVLNRGDVFTISTVRNESDLSGSLVEATKPIAVLAGVQLGNVPKVLRWFNALIEMQRPVAMWGRQYHVAKLPQREKHSYVRAYAIRDSTKLWIDDVPQDELQSIPLSSRYNFYNDRISKGDEKGLLLTSSAPIYVSQLNTGIEDGQDQRLESFQMDLVPVELYDTIGLFAIPRFEQFATSFKSNCFVSIIYENPHSSIPNHLEYAHEFAGSFDWKPVKDLYHIKHGKPVGTDGNWWVVNFSVSEEDMIALRCENSFYAYVYGYGSCASFGTVPTGKTTWLNSVDSVAPNLLVVSENRSSLLVEGFDEGGAGIAMVNLLNDNSGFRLSDYKHNLTNETITCVVEFPVGIDRDTAVLLLTDRAGNEKIVELAHERCNSRVPSIPELGDYVQTNPSRLYEKGSSSVVLSNPTDSTIFLSNLRTSSSDVFSITSASLSISAHSSKVLEIDHAPQTEKGILVGTILGTDVCDREHILTRIETPIIGGNLAYPERFVFPPTPYFSVIQRNITIANVSSVDINVNDIQFSSEREQLKLLTSPIVLPIALKPGDSLVLTVQFTAALPFRAEGIIQLATDSEIPNIEIELEGEVVISSIADLKSHGISLEIIPHPATGDVSKLHVQSNRKVEAQLQFYDSSGRRVGHSSTVTLFGESEIEMPSMLPPGLAIVSLAIDGMQFFQTFMVQ